MVLEGFLTNDSVIGICFGLFLAVLGNYFFKWTEWGLSKTSVRWRNRTARIESENKQKSLEIIESEDLKLNLFLREIRLRHKSADAERFALCQVVASIFLLTQPVFQSVFFQCLFGANFIIGILVFTVAYYTKKDADQIGTQLEMAAETSAKQRRKEISDNSPTDK